MVAKKYSSRMVLTLVAEARFACRKEMVKHQIKVATVFHYSLQLMPRCSCYTQLFIFLSFPDCLFTVGIFHYTLLNVLYIYVKAMNDCNASLLFKFKVD